MSQLMPALTDRDAHVWKVRLDAVATDVPERDVLSEAERERMARFFTPHLRARFAIAHRALRRVLSRYTGVEPASLRFSEGEFGKPSLVGSTIEFNLSHSGDIALIAVARGRAVGVDVEQWKPDVEHHAVAEYCFSESEQRALRELGERHTPAGFFSAWARKEAYIKASGAGVTGGLDHFDVALEPDATLPLLADRRDARATERWVMRSINVAAGYSAALVVEAPLDAIQLFEATPTFP